MAYKYNEKTGEFEGIPQSRKKTSPIVETPDYERQISRPRSSTIPRTPPAYTPPSRSTSTSSSSSGGFWEGLGSIIVGALPYIIGILLAVMCN